VDDERVLRYLYDPPRWLPAVLGGVVGGALLGMFFKLNSASSVEAGGIALIGGTLIGAGIARWYEPSWSSEVAGLAAGERRAALRATYRGPVPVDPEIRTAAIRIASHQLPKLEQYRRFALPLYGLILICAVAGFVAGGSWLALLSGAIAVVNLYVAWYQPRHLRRRIELSRRQ
jgi:hypothetical protein